MASEQMTEYERKRLENIKRNSEMMASLKIQSHISDLSSAVKHLRQEKSYKQTSAKKPKVETPIVIRRSLRIQELPPDSIGLPEHCNDLPVKPSKPRALKRRQLLSPDLPPLPLEDLSMELTYEGEEGSHLALVEKLGRLARKTRSNDELDHANSNKEFVKVEAEEPFDLCSVKEEQDNVAQPQRSTRNAKSDDQDNHSNSPSKSTRVKLRESVNPRLLKLENNDSDNFNSPTKFERVKLEEPIDLHSFNLEHYNIARVVPGRIFSIRFFPTTEMTMIAVGNKSGHLGFWDARPQNGEEDVIHLYKPHSAPISGISVHPFALSEVYSSSYDGLLRKMNIELEKFELVYSYYSGVFSLAQKPDDVNTLYLGDGSGELNMLDTRMADVAASSWSLHGGRINTIDFSPKNPNIMATSSTDGLACIWDLRNMNFKVEDKHPEIKAMSTIHHARAVHSAYFSPTGSFLATTSLDDKIGVLSGVNFEDTIMIPHDNRTNRWVSSFRAVWGWDDTHLYVGNMKRKVDVLSVSQKKLVYTLESSNMTAIPCRYDAHPCNTGMLAAATSGGQVYLWTASS